MTPDFTGWHDYQTRRYGNHFMAMSEYFENGRPCRRGDARLRGLLVCNSFGRTVEEAERRRDNDKRFAIR